MAGMSYLYCLLLLLFLQQAKPTPPSGMPVGDGVYCRQSDGSWTRLQPVSMAGTKTKGMESFIDTAGYTNLSMTAAYKGAHAPIQISATRPDFFVRGVGSPNDAMILQLTMKKDSRELHASSTASSIENKGGFRKSEIRKVTVLVYSDDSFSVTPDEALSAGEYLFVFGYANAAFDFGITAGRH